MTSELSRELGFAWRESALRWTLMVVLVIVTVALLVGHFASAEQQAQVAHLLAESEEDRVVALAGKTDPGDIAYYDFHLTYAPPSELAFIALGLRDELAWKHRLRALALEGQIHETDEGNTELMLLGRLDFAYFAAVLLPLFVIGLLFDLHDRERRESRYELVCATSRIGERVFLVRALARLALLYGAITLPLIPFLIINDVDLMKALGVMGVVLAHLIFWLAICQATKSMAGVTAAVSLLSLWMVTVIAIPVVGKSLTEQFVSAPAGGQLLLQQRETVNQAWDLPKEATMDPFTALHPEWADYVNIDRPFEWKWYYAFQEMGDQSVQPISEHLYHAMHRRNQAMGWVALLSPTLLTERALTRVAETDLLAHLGYVKCARAFHAQLRQFYYPMLFGKVPFSERVMAQTPEYRPCV